MVQKPKSYSVLSIKFKFGVYSLFKGAAPQIIGVLVLTMCIGEALSENAVQRLNLETDQSEEFQGDDFKSDETGNLSELFYRIQVLQQELKELRGILEEQSYLLSRLERSQKEQYLDLDGRVLALTGVDDDSFQTDSDAKIAQLESEPLKEFADEREAYQYAFDLMRNRRYEESLLAFEQIIINYPNGQYTPNAFYWIGELNLAEGDNEKSRQSFIQVINLYPDHQKVPDALYKLGVVYFGLGDNAAALKYLKQVQRDYPESSAAGLAERYSSEIQ